MIKRTVDKFIADSWDEMGIDIPQNKTHAQIDIKIKNCPVCAEEGKRNESSLSVNPFQGVGKCHKCGTKYVIRKAQPERVVSKKEWTPPSRKNMTNLSKDGLQYIINRKITQEAVNRHKLVQENGQIAFPYLYNGELVNVKYRGIKEKSFRQSPNGMHVLYNYDNAIEYMESSGEFSVVVTEGEFDTLSFESQSIHYAVSVDGGAPNEKDTKVDGKLECIDNCMYIFDLAEVVYIAVDNDPSGRRLKEELCRRIDAEKIRIVDWGKYKDANEALMYDEKLQDFLDAAKEIKLEGVFYAEDVYDKLDDIYENGLPKGTTTHLPSLDKHWTWRIGEVNLWTGYQNEGKSTMIYYLSMLQAAFDGKKFALFTPENFPIEEFYEETIHMYVGKTTDREVLNRMSKAEFDDAKDFVNRHFFLMYPEDNANIDSIL
jgi:twinkle protein